MQKLIIILTIVFHGLLGSAKATDLITCKAACESNDLPNCLSLGEGFPQFSILFPDLAILKNNSITQLQCGKKLHVNHLGIIKSNDIDCELSMPEFQGPKFYLPKIIVGKILKTLDSQSYLSFSNSKSAPQVRYDAIGGTKYIKDFIENAEGMYIWTSHNSEKVNCFSVDKGAGWP